MERILKSRSLIFLSIVIPFSLGVIGYMNLHKKGALAEVSALTTSAADASSASLVIQPAGVPDRITGKLNARLNSGDRLETGAGTTATLEFADGSEIEIAPDSRVVVERDENLIPPQTALQILVGSAKSTQVGSGRLILITNQNAREIGALSLSGFSQTENETATTGTSNTAGAKTSSTSTTVTSSTLSAAGSEVAETAAVPANSLPSEYIESIVRGQRSHISKCFSDLLQKATKASGRMDVSFTIENSGKIARVHILGSTLTDSHFNGCITQVFEQLKFKQFQGEPIIVNYPLQFQ